MQVVSVVRVALALCLVALVGCHEINSVVPDPATAGEDITISGRGFGGSQGTSQVLYDGEELSVTSWSSDAIVATLPRPKPDGTYELTVAAAQDSVSIPHTIELPGMVLVPGGTFYMGSGAFGSDEHPIHEIQLDAFYIDQTEVTVAAYQDCVDAHGACTAPPTGGFCSWGVAGEEQHPVNCVDWFDSVDYCTWAGKRLPTEAEWEKAAHGTEFQRTYPWGEQAPTCDYAVMNEQATPEGSGCGLNRTWPVGSKPLGDSPYEAWDMAGNVWEWVSDWYDPWYYLVSPSSNPPGPATGMTRVLRGGSWGTAAAGLRTAARVAARPASKGIVYGFRCARDG